MSASLALDREGDTHAAPDTQRRESPLGVALAHLVKQRHQDAAAGGADRVAERNGAAVHVDLGRVPAHLAIDGDGLRRERFVDLHQIEILRLPAGARQRAGWEPKDLDLMEINEAFAAQAIAVNRQMGWDTAKVNVNGGAIALGHPIGASGCRVLVTLLHEMAKRDAKRGLASLCIGGGMGVALAVER